MGVGSTFKASLNIEKTQEKSWPCVCGLQICVLACVVCVLLGHL